MSARSGDLSPRRELVSGPSALLGPESPSPGRGKVAALTGNEAAALAVKQVEPHVAAAYPITPQTELMHAFARYVADGEVNTEYVAVESEHSAMSLVLAAAAAGARAFTATSSNGFAYMIEPVTNAGALRLPIVMSLVNRHVAGFLNIHNDHTDAMLGRNAAWLQLFAENSQETYDNLIQAFRIGEDGRVRLPVICNHDGFIVSHTLERLLVLSDQEVSDFVGDYVALTDLLDTANPRGIGPLLLPDWTSQFYAQTAEAMRGALGVIQEVGEEFGRLTGRSYGLFEPYRLEGAQVAIIAMGSVNGTVRRVVDVLRANGAPVGMIKLRVFRPFPARELARAIFASGVRVLSVLEKVNDLGSGGPLFNEVGGALAAEAGMTGGRIPLLLNHLTGLGGRDVTLAQVNGVFGRLLEVESRGVIRPEEQFSTLDAGGTGEKVLAVSGSRLVRALVSFPRTFVFAARGGQGAKTACYLFAQMAVDMGQYAQGFPTYGPERTGAPIKGFARVGPEPIPEREEIHSPDVLSVFDESLLDGLRQDIASMPEDGVLLVNTRRSPAELRAALGVQGRRLFTLDADGIAWEEFHARRPNAALMAAIMHITGIADLETFRKAFSKKMAKLTPEVLAGNLRAIDRAVRELRSEPADGKPQGV